MNQLDIFAGGEPSAPTVPQAESDWQRERRLIAALPLWPDRPREWFSWGRNKKRVACECLIGNEAFFIVSDGGECALADRIDISPTAERKPVPTTREEYAEKQTRKLIGDARLDDRPYFHIVEHFEPRYVGCDFDEHPHLIEDCAPVLFGSGSVEYRRKSEYSPDQIKKLERQNDFINTVFRNSNATLNERLRHEKLTTWQRSIILEVLRRMG